MDECLNHVDITLQRMLAYIHAYMLRHRNDPVVHLAAIQKIRDDIEQVEQAIAQPDTLVLNVKQVRKGLRALKHLRSLNHLLLIEGQDIIYESEPLQSEDARAMRAAIDILQAAAGT